jgi:tRNA (cmo5U34)-methyltransferase
MSDENPVGDPRSGFVDSGYAPATWAFDDEVTRVFDDMLRRSIPQYDVMREAVLEIGKRFAVQSTAIVDLGAARGEALAPFVSYFGAYNRYVALEVSDPMLAALRERFASSLVEKDWPKSSQLVDVRKHDLRLGLPKLPPASLVLSVLTLQFTPIEFRPLLVTSVYKSLLSGGGFVLVEKVLGSSGPTQTLLVDLYHRHKEAAGYTKDEIERKRLALEGVLVPLSASQNEALLRDAGFRYVECFWRWMNFAAWIAVRE